MVSGRDQHDGITPAGGQVGRLDRQVPDAMQVKAVAHWLTPLSAVEIRISAAS